MGTNLTAGGPLTHGSAVNMSGKYFHVVPYGVDKETECIDYDALEKQAKEVKPKLIVAGASAYARIIDFERLSAIAKAVELSAEKYCSASIMLGKVAKISHSFELAEVQT